jgi:hypothetical protein
VASCLTYGHGEAELDLGSRARLTHLTVLYGCSNLRKGALRRAPEAVQSSGKPVELFWTLASTSSGR